MVFNPCPNMELFASTANTRWMCKVFIWETFFDDLVIYCCFILSSDWEAWLEAVWGVTVWKEATKDWTEPHFITEAKQNQTSQVYVLLRNAVSKLQQLCAPAQTSHPTVSGRNTCTHFQINHLLLSVCVSKQGFNFDTCSRHFPCSVIIF